MTEDKQEAPYLLMMNGVLTPCSAAEFEQWLTEAARAMVHHSDSKASIIGLAAHAFSSLRLAAEQRAEEIKGLKADLGQWRSWGIIEVAIRNPNVQSYMDHWEGRALKAEAELSSLKTEHDRLQRLVRDDPRGDTSKGDATAFYIGE